MKTNSTACGGSIQADEALLRALRDDLESRFDAAAGSNGTTSRPAAMQTLLANWDDTLSNALQLAPQKGVLGGDLDAELQRLYADHVAVPRASGRPGVPGSCGTLRSLLLAGLQASTPVEPPRLRGVGGQAAPHATVRRDHGTLARRNAGSSRLIRLRNTAAGPSCGSVPRLLKLLVWRVVAVRAGSVGGFFSVRTLPIRPAPARTSGPCRRETTFG